MNNGNNPRWQSFPIKWDERPRQVYLYYVSGTGLFPLDMLRFDAAWPHTTDDALQLSRTIIDETMRSIQLRSYREPTLARWASFGWSVGLEKL